MTKTTHDSTVSLTPKGPLKRPKTLRAENTKLRRLLSNAIWNYDIAVDVADKLIARTGAIVQVHMGTGQTRVRLPRTGAN